MNCESAHKLGVLAIVVLCTASGLAENIDPYENAAQYAYADNAGWLNFEPAIGPGVTVSTDGLTGFIWAENMGWISLSCQNTGTCSAVSYGVTGGASGYLQGYAWAENIGWINFAPQSGGVTIDANGEFHGWAWGENIGWIHLRSVNPMPYGVQACVVQFEDLANLADAWLESSAWLEANLDAQGPVDFADYGILASYWHDYCPDGWRLKPTQ